jgi:hypothetical protein
MVVDGARIAQRFEQGVTPAQHRSDMRTAAAAAAHVMTTPPEQGDRMLVD